MNTPHMNTLREQLLSTLADLRDRNNPMEPDRARAVAQVASVLVDTAKVEVDFLKATGQAGSTFLQPGTSTPALTGTGNVQRLPGVTTHRMGD